MTSDAIKYSDKLISEIYYEIDMKSIFLDT